MKKRIALLFVGVLFSSGCILASPTQVFASDLAIRITPSTDPLSYPIEIVRRDNKIPWSLDSKTNLTEKTKITPETGIDIAGLTVSMAKDGSIHVKNARQKLGHAIENSVLIESVSKLIFHESDFREDLTVDAPDVEFEDQIRAGKLTVKKGFYGSRRIVIGNQAKLEAKEKINLEGVVANHGKIEAKEFLNGHHSRDFKN